MFRYVLFAVLFSWSLPAWALRPMSAPVALVAGTGTEGYRDGDFYSAQFNKPFGLALSEDGNSLFVADSGNNRIRVVHLDAGNQVTTLLGKQTAGKDNGDLTGASLNDPRGLLALPGGRLVINDFGNNLLRLVDLKKGEVSILAGGGPEKTDQGPADKVALTHVRDMAYLPSADSIFFSQPDEGGLKRLDLKTLNVSWVFFGKKEVPAPTCLCVTNGKLYVADRDLADVYELAWKSDKDFTLTSVGKPATGVSSLVGNGNSLYEYHYGDRVMMEELFPRPIGVTFVNPFGEPVPEQLNPAFTDTPHVMPVGFTPDPSDITKFYLANPNSNIIASIRNVSYTMVAGGDPYSTGGLSDFDYPVQKPPHTFRILLVGDSRSVMVVSFPFPPTWNIQQNYSLPGPPRQISFAKRMETELNTLAALDDQPLNFEVLNDSHSAAVPLFLWPTYELADTVAKNDVDLILLFHPPTIYSVYPYKFYFTFPLTADGIPAHNSDSEYLMKPPLKRIPDGDARHFYDLCKARKMVHIEGSNFVFDDKAIHTDPALHDSLVQLYGKPLGPLVKKLSALRNSAGKPIPLVMLSMHTGYIYKDWNERSIWKEVAQKYGVPFLDLNDTMSALQLSFFPVDDSSSDEHFNQDGHLFISGLLVHELIKGGFLPWTAVSPNSTPGPGATPTPAPKR